MDRGVEYEWTKFSPETMKAAVDALTRELPADQRRDDPVRLAVDLKSVAWSHDSEEEFFADYRTDCASATYDTFPKNRSTAYRLIVCYYGGYSTRTVVDISAPSRQEVLAAAEVFERAAESARVPRPVVLTPESGDEARWESRVTVFIGHGRDPAWRELSDCLEKQHSIRTEAFEFAANAGHATRSILERHMGSASFAALVMTAEDEHADGTAHARENVIHESGLFQGRLGFDRAIVLLEDGCAEFSNIHGIQQIRFPRGRIKGTIGELLATLRREFDPSER